jgi:gliding motility-associated-like protein
VPVSYVTASFTTAAQYVSRSNCPPLQVSCTSTTFDITQYAWDFGDGSPQLTVPDPVHTYSKAGKHYITLNAAGPGTTVTVVDSVTVNGPYGTSREHSSKQFPLGCSPYRFVPHGYDLLYPGLGGWDGADRIISGYCGFSCLRGARHIYTRPYPQRCGRLQRSLLRRPKFQGIINAPDSGCAGIPLTFGATPAIGGPPWPGGPTGPGSSPTYGWIFPGGHTDTAQKPAPLTLAQGNDTVLLVVEFNGCYDTSSAILQVFPDPIPSIMPGDTVVCRGSPVPLSASGGISYQWGDTAGLSSSTTASPVALPAATSTYTVQVWNGHGCSARDSAFISVIQPFILRVTADTAVCLGDSLTLPVSGGSVTLHAEGSGDVASWSWSPATYLNCTACEDPQSTPLRNITYTVTGKTAEGCTASDTVVVQVICMASNVRVPGAFTPNNDGINDVFYPMGQGVSLVKEFRVYGRWGNLVFERHNAPFGDPSSGWDGRAAGKDQPPGAYIYELVLQCITGETFDLKGSVMLESIIKVCKNKDNG